MNDFEEEIPNLNGISSNQNCGTGDDIEQVSQPFTKRFIVEDFFCEKFQILENLEQSYLLKEKQVLDLMFKFHNVKLITEEIQKQYPDPKLLKKTTIGFGTRKLNDLNKLNNSTISKASKTSKRSVSSTTTTKSKLVATDFEKKDKYKLVSPKVSINIGFSKGKNEMSQSRDRRAVKSSDTNMATVKLNSSTSNLMNTNITPMNKTSYTKLNDSKSSQKNIPSRTIHTKNNGRASLSTNETSTINDKLKKSQKDIKNLIQTSNNIMNNTISTSMQRLSYKFEPKKKPSTQSSQNDNPFEFSSHKNTKIPSMNEETLNVVVTNNGSSSQFILNTHSRSNSDQIAIKNRLKSLESKFDKFFNNEKNYQIYDIIILFSNNKNKIKNISRFIRYAYINIQIKKIENIIYEKSNDEYKSKHNALEVILELEILSHKLDKLKQYLKSYEYINFKINN